METDWDEVTRIPFPPPGQHALSTPVSAIAFDSAQELLWTGNEYGRVTSFYSPELQRYTSFRAHASREGAVKQLLFCEKGVLSISSRSVHLGTRKGLVVWHLIDDRFRDLRCMSFALKGNHEILVAGCQDTMFKINVEKGVITQALPAEEGYTLMKRGGLYICAASQTGSVHLLDPNTFRVVKIWKAHLGWINDMDARSDFLVTCGFSPRQQHGYMLDPLANVFDLKTLMPLPPIPFQPGAAFVRMHPRMSTTSIVASQGGQLQVVDIMNPNTVNLRQANIFDAYLMALELAPSGEALALADSSCMVHLWGSPSKIHFTEYSTVTEFPDQALPPPPMDWNPDTPLNKIGMPYYRETLLSAWPHHMIFEVGAPPSKIDPLVLARLQRAEIGGFAPNPRRTRRYQVENQRDSDSKSDALAVPKFLSERAKEEVNSAQDGGQRRISDALDAFDGLTVDNLLKREVPIMYRNVEIKYSKFGVDDFDFEYYNKTKYSGLETHIANSYANPLLQLYKFTPMLRNLALHHTASSCLFETCLLCEMGFLFDMLEKASGQNCQATNLLKTFSSLSHAASLGLLEEQAPNTPLAVMIQSVNRFLLDKMATDFRQIAPQASHMDQALTTSALTSIRCIHCASEMIRPGSTYLHELIYPPKTMKPPMHVQRSTFSQILKASVERQDQTRGWCDRCKRYQQLSTRKTIQSVPAVLMINAAIHSPEAKHLWLTPNWLPREIGIIVDQGQFFCYEGQDLMLHVQRGVHNIMVYELIGVVADINSGEHEKPHLVSMINVGLSEPNADVEPQWHLFNDFLVRQISKEEALRFDAGWKLPSILAYQAKSVNGRIDNSWKNNLDTSILYRRWSTGREPEAENVRVLSAATEAPTPGTPVAIDAEFVALQREEIEVKADGTRETIRPSRLGLARVSVLRGAGEYAGEPFIDDYIAISEPVVDYLTAFSGIAPGDLDRGRSRHALVGLKVTYKKLWLLLNLGVVFVGHGLAKDFRTITIHVPRAQVVDTVDLFFIRARQRRLGLRFLAWYLLHEEIQTGTHDSVEDARTALKLWRKYEHYVEAGVLEPVLNDVYKRGRELGFKAPGSSGVAGGAGAGAGAGGIAVGVAGAAGTGGGMSSARGWESGRATPDLPLVASAAGSPAVLVRKVAMVAGAETGADAGASAGTGAESRTRAEPRDGTGTGTGTGSIANTDASTSDGNAISSASISHPPNT